MRFRIGTMGFSYDDWRGPFYPRELRRGDWLAYYAQHLDSIELDTTFHAVPSLERFERWASVVPETFRFAVKAPRAITHDGKLEDAPAALREFGNHAQRGLGTTLGAILVQFPPHLSARAWPGVERALAAVARQRYRVAVEFRNDSWFDDPDVAPRVLDGLRDLNVALVGAEYDVLPPREPVATADFAYLRFIGKHERYKVLDHERWDATERLHWWLDRVTPLEDRGVRATWALFNNDYAGFSIATADRLKALTGQPVEPMHVRQGRLF